MLRPYQKDAAQAAIEEMRRSISPCLIDAATGSGKSHIIAEVAIRIHAMTGKRVLCLAPSGELVEQNHGKYIATGNPASMFSASVGQKSLRHPVVFGSPLTVKNRISRFMQTGQDGFGLVIVDECHAMTPTIIEIIREMREANQNLRVLGLTATPYVLGKGYVFKIWPDGRANGDDACRSPYFAKSVYRVDARDLIDQGFLSRPVILPINAPRYDTGGMEVDGKGSFRKEDIDRAYHGHGRETAAIIDDVIYQSRHTQGVMVFAATVQHAHEVMASLPPEISAIVTATTPKPERRSIIARFKSKAIKYLVNVGALTTGFDATHIGIIAILRKTESVTLFQQIIGRGSRVEPGKTTFGLLDYTTNLEDHCPDSDLYAPDIKAKAAGGGGPVCEVVCPLCATTQTHALNKDFEGAIYDDAGYMINEFGEHVLNEYGPTAVHYGRRCAGMVKTGAKGEYERCEYRWTSKPCPHCDEPNDIAARYCVKCKGEIVNPNDRLIFDFKALKKDPTQRQTDTITSIETRDGVSQAGNRTVRADFVTPHRHFSVWFMPESNSRRAQTEWELFRDNQDATTVTYKKEANGFFRVLDYNAQIDEAPHEQV